MERYMTGEPATNGYIRWRDLDDRDQRIRKDHDEAYRRLEETMTNRLDKAHQYHTGLAEKQNAAILANSERVNDVESVLDQQRGARNLVYGLIGTNLIAIILLFADMLNSRGTP